MNNDFRITVCSDLDYEEMVADVKYKDHTIAIISQESGYDKMEMELFACFENEAPLQIPLDGFLQILNYAKNQLIKMQKLP